ncbi:MAG: phosphoenolpyruvate--protein phosphotransferase [Alphaproteobacteria bacterium]
MPEQAPRRGTWTASRRMLQRARDVMASRESAQARLDRLATMIAREMVAEVCSIYVLRAGDVLELFATEGLLKTAVHQTRLRVGEGLVGDIAAHARPLRLADAASHPRFAYRPETGEEAYHSLVGVPVLRNGRVTGVLVVQNRSPRDYADEEVETLETIAMVLAEMIAGGELVDPREQRPADGLALRPLRISGIGLSAGLRIGVAFPHSRQPQTTRLVAEDPKAEHDRLTDAVRAMQRAVDAMLDRLSWTVETGEHTEVMESYRLFAHDRGWLGRIREAIDTGLTAEAAVQRVGDDMRARFAQISDPYLRERLLDVDDVNNRLMMHLTGAQITADDLPPQAIIVARDLGPAELLDFMSDRLAGVVLEEGSPTSHVAIVARALEIPMVGRARGILAQVERDDPLVVDGDGAQVFVRPGDDVLSTVSETVAARALLRARYEAERDQPAVTVDGHRVALRLNAGLQADLSQLERTGAESIGLYRTEIAFMVRPNFPDAAEQTEIYRRIVGIAGEREVVFRTLDVGGDKALPYFRPQVGADENPAMGWRAIRLSLDRPVILRTQLRALIAASVGRGLSLMFPMIADVDEFQRARAVLDKELGIATAAGLPLPQPLRVGVMVEVPSLVWQLEALLPLVDFVSIGSNDLMQFAFAADRSSPSVAGRYDVLSPPALSLLAAIVDRCAGAQVPVTICGEMAGRPLEAMACIGLGVRSLSMAASAVGPVRAMVRSLDAGAVGGFVRSLLAAPDRTLRGRLRGFARDHGVVV